MTTEEVMAVDERLARLEKTVAESFFEHGGRLDKIDGRLDKIDGRFDGLEDRMTALDSKVDIAVESIRGDVKTVLEVMTGFIGEMRRTTDSMRKEHAADRRLTRSILLDHVTRIRTLEDDRSTGGQ